ncbi:DUF3347 domain-containing protein [Flaviaesturariibacter aridisoli]|uniref:DUF3347 domain-containing protein n=1 Tax=Flaviaesturariibacter aridisoli TaxID=2545761 RepID=A0A4R4DXQ9_9BACT|nr:DUF3347 domain-containing protein [Flaviaesturariibacter aridisoli]TCZ69891.1 DUF3347 domain-containing protein [Flaviaesturariibacter aridisoli]
MKRIFPLLLALLFAGAAEAQADPAPGKLLATYLQVKDALLAGDAAHAGAAADSFVRVANTIDYKLISEDNIRILAGDAARISAAKSLEAQRSVFANLSKNMVAVAQSLKLSDAPLYVDYCPMKRAFWLSAGKAIRNPYYGNAMLTCGQVQSTIP